MPPRLATVLAALALFGGGARAEGVAGEGPLPVRLAFQAPAGCPDRREFLGQLHARDVRIREAQPGEVAPSIRVELRVLAGQVDGALALYPGGDGPGEETGRRDIQGADCRSVVAGLALVAAVILDPSVRPSGDASSPVSSAEAPASEGPPSAVTSPPLSAPPPHSTGRSAPTAHLSAGAAFEVAAGQGPGPALVPRAYLEVTFPAPIGWGGVRLSVGHGYPGSVDTTIGTAQITLTDVRIEPCARVASAKTLQLHVCGFVEGGALAGQGTNTTMARSETRGFFELGAGLRPTWAVSDQIEVGLLVAGALPISRFRFYFAPPDTTAYVLGSWSVLGELCVGLRFL